QRRYAEAEPLVRRALAINEKVRGPEHPAVAYGLNNLARLYRAQGRGAEAEPLHQRALAIDEKMRGSELPTTRRIRTDPRSTQQDLGRPAAPDDEERETPD